MSVLVLILSWLGIAALAALIIKAVRPTDSNNDDEDN